MLKQVVILETDREKGALLVGATTLVSSVLESLGVFGEAMFRGPALHCLKELAIRQSLKPEDINRVCDLVTDDVKEEKPTKKKAKKVAKKKKAKARKK